MYRTLNKIFKIAGNRLITQTLSRNGLSNYSRALTYTSKSNFSEKFEKVGGGRFKERQIGNLNLRQTFTGSENFKKILEHFENNIQSMNEADFIDALIIISYKISSEYSAQFTRLVRISKSYQIIRDWMNENFDKVYETNNPNLILIAFETHRNNLNLFDTKKRSMICQQALDFTERSINNGRGQPVKKFLI
jgi:hypothetical protein